MPQAWSNFSTKTNSKINSLHPQASFLIPTKQNRMNKSSTIAKKIPENLAANTPMEVGTRGTVGALIMREIEYFSQLESRCQQSSQQPQFQNVDMASSSSQRADNGPAITTQKKKKRGGRKLLPSICSMVEVSDSNRPVGISALNYRNLKTDTKKLQV